MAYGCANGYVRLLRPASGLVKTLGAHGDRAAVTHVAVGGGGVNVVVVSAAVDGTVKVGENEGEVCPITVLFFGQSVTCQKYISRIKSDKILALDANYDWVGWCVAAMKEFRHRQGPPASL